MLDLFFLLVLSVPIGAILSPFLFEKYYFFLVFIIISFFVIFLIKKKKYLGLFYLFFFLILTYISSYGTYKAFFYTSFSEKEKIKTVKELKERCKNEPKDTKNFNCSRYFSLLNLCKEKTGKTDPLDCKDYIVYGGRVENIKK